MTRRREGYTIHPFPQSRRIVIDSARLGSRKHNSHGFLEVDVTEARRIIREHHAASGERISFTAFIIACLGRAIDDHREVQAIRNLWGNLVVFDDADIATIIEIELEGKKFPLAHIIRSANTRSVRSIHDEIRSVQHNPRGDITPGTAGFMRWFLAMPTFLRDFAYTIIMRSPKVAKARIGTAILTAFGMFGSGGGWGLNNSHYTLSVMVGGIVEKPAVVKGEIVPREFLHITLSVDHDIVDGAPASRFARTFVTLLESAHGLSDLQSPQEP